MTKDKWFKKLQECLNVLPFDESQGVIDYYTELYNEKSEKGEKESDILEGFGSPEKLALEITKKPTAKKKALGKKFLPLIIVAVAVALVALFLYLRQKAQVALFAMYLVGALAALGGVAAGVVYIIYIFIFTIFLIMLPVLLIIGIHKLVKYFTRKREDDQRR